MFQRSSRYYQLDDAIYQTPHGQPIVYKRRRLLPQGAAMPQLNVVSADSNNRLDLVASRVLGAAEHFWRICDANNAMNPFTVIADTGGQLRIAPPQFQDITQSITSG